MQYSYKFAKKAKYIIINHVLSYDFWDQFNQIYIVVRTSQIKCKIDANHLRPIYVVRHLMKVVPDTWEN